MSVSGAKESVITLSQQRSAWRRLWMLQWEGQRGSMGAACAGRTSGQGWLAQVAARPVQATRPGPCHWSYNQALSRVTSCTFTRLTMSQSRGPRSRLRVPAKKLHLHKAKRSPRSAMETSTMLDDGKERVIRFYRNLSAFPSRANAALRRMQTGLCFSLSEMICRKSQSPRGCLSQLQRHAPSGNLVFTMLRFSCFREHLPCHDGAAWLGSPG